jgi:hypothetical protein
MAFAYSGGTITQTGTDANLSGISGLTGVTTSVRGAVTSYSLDASTKLTVSGHLTIDPRVNFLEMLRDGNASFIISGTGTLILGADLSYTYGTQVTTGLALRAIGRAAQPWQGYLRSDGIIEWYGATLDMGGGIETRSGGSAKIREGVFISQPSTGSNQGHQIFFLGGSTCDIIGLNKTLGTGTDRDNASVGINGIATVTNLSGVTSTGSVAADNRSATLAPVPYISMNGFTPLDRPLIAATTAFPHMIDCSGLYVDSMSLGRRGAFGTVTRHGQVDAYKTCNGKLTLNSVGVSGIKVAWTDVDNGGRGTTAATEWGQEYLTDRTYTDTTDVNGEFTQSVLESAWYTTNPLAASGWQGYSADKRLEASEKITFKCFSYLNSPSTIQFVGNTTTPSDAVSPQSSDPTVTELVKATVDAYATIDTSAEFYDRAKSYLYDNFNQETVTMVSRAGALIDAGAYDVTIDATAVSAFALAGNIITIKASTFTGDMTTTGTITLANGATYVGTRTDTNGTIYPPLVVSVTNIVAGSRLQVYNVNTATIVHTAIIAGTSYTAEYAEGTGYTTGDVIRVRLASQTGVTAMLIYETSAVAGATGWSVLANQLPDAIYNSYGIDGSTITEFSFDGVNIEVDINDTDNITEIQRLAAWITYFETTEIGVNTLFGSMLWESLNSVRVDVSVYDFTVDNTKVAPMLLQGGRLFRSDGTTVISATSNSIHMDYSPVYIANAPDITAIKNNTNLIPALL